MSQAESRIEAVRQAIAAMGSQRALADLCGITQSAVSKWLRGKLLGAEHVLKIEAATGVSRHALRPDIFAADVDSVADRHNGVRA